MTTTLERTTDFRSHLATLGCADDPFRLKALELFETLGIPTVKHEEWKYTNLRDLASTLFSPATEFLFKNDELPELPPIYQVDALRIVTVNGLVIPELSDWSHLSQLGHELSLTRLAETGDEPFLNDNPFVALNAALWTDGMILKIVPGAVIDKPILILNLTIAGSKPIAVHNRLVIEAGENSQSRIFEAYYGLGGTVFTNAVTTVKVNQNAILEHVRIQEETGTSFHIATTKADQAANSTYRANNVSFGSLLGRTDFDVWVGGEHAETALNGAYMAFDEQLIDNHTRIDHALPNCHSFEVYKGILGDKGTGVFNGKIYVHLDAQKTDAKQSNKALLLSPTATMNSKPQLEIFADDVKCTHGATVGQINDEQLFYLRSRGLPLDQARSLLVYAFVSEVIDKISFLEVRELLEARVFERVMQMYED